MAEAYAIDGCTCAFVECYMQTELVERIRNVILPTFHHLFLLAVRRRRTLRDGPIVRTATASGACKQSMVFGV